MGGSPRKEESVMRGIRREEMKGKAVGFGGVQKMAVPRVLMEREGGLVRGTGREEMIGGGVVVVEAQKIVTLRVPVEREGG